MYRKFSEALETFQSVQIFLKYPETFQRVRKLFRLCLNTFQRVQRKHNILSGNFPNYPKTFQRFQKLSRVSRNFQEVPETFHSVCKLCRVSRNFPKSRNFQGHPETFLIVRKLFIKFLCFHAKTFRITKPFHQAMLECW